MGCTARADGSLLSRTQKTPPFQTGVALPLLIQRLARAGVEGMNGCCSWPITGTNMCDKPLSGVYIPFAADHRSGARLGRRLARSVGCHTQVDSASFNRPLLSLDKLVSQLPSLALRWQVGSLHKPPHSMLGSLPSP